MTVRLRPHHLLCILTYVGGGYSPAFIANMTAIARRLDAGEAVEIVEGPDDICAPLLDGPDPHCHRAGITERDRAASLDMKRLLDLEIHTGASLMLDAGLVSRLREAFASNQIRSACAGCEWVSLCSCIAASRFAGTVMNDRCVQSNG